MKGLEFVAPEENTRINVDVSAILRLLVAPPVYRLNLVRCPRISGKYSTLI